MSFLLRSASKPRCTFKDTRSSHTFHPSGQQILFNRTFTSTRRDFLSAPPSEPKSPIKIITAKPFWPNPIYTKTNLQEKICVAHRPPKDWADWAALKMVRILRKGTDIATGYKHHVVEPNAVGEENSFVKTRSMSEKDWLTRFVFLERVAGVPGMVAGMLRHLHSLRRLKKDNGWIEPLLEEAYNERMHLLTFLSLGKPGWIVRIMIIGARGVFFNRIFIAYFISPRTCHRFIAYLEEEARLTYSLAIRDIDEGRLPAWTTLPTPDIPVKYWKMTEGERMMRDLLLRVRADEAKHREVNHTLGNLDQEVDHNPFNRAFAIDRKQYPSKGIENIRPTGWERKEVIS